MKDFITAQGLQQLRLYKYKPGKYTKIDQLLNPYWEWVVKQLPQWIAPNLITFIGWIFVILSYLVMLRYDYTFQKDIPNWCFLFAGACVWIYSTLDAVDGKQARRTKSSSPLGQLFDHGCDSFSITFFVLALGQAAKLEGLEIFILFVACQSAFWSSNWTEYKTGVLMTSVGQFGVTETELVSMIVHLLTGIFGQNMWQVKIGEILPWTFNLQGRQILSWTLELKLGGFIAFYFGGLIFFSCMYLFIKTILTSEDKIKPIRECFTFYLIVIIMLIWYKSQFYNEFRGMILLNLGLLCSLIICKVIISSVTKMSLPYFHLETLPTIVATVLLLLLQSMGNQATVQTVFWICFGVNLITILNFLVRVVRQITTFLGIHCFSLKKREQLKNN